MKNHSNECLRRAKEARDWAATIKRENLKAKWLHIAAKWEFLAEERPQAERMAPRTQGSLAFEEFWRSLRKKGALVPARGDFQPSKAARFLHNIVLLEAPGESRNSLTFRLAGPLFQNAVQYPVAGIDHLDILPPQYHAGALASVRLMVSKPCGLWQVMPFHLKGISRLVELTAFPLAPGGDGIPLVLGYISPLEGLGLAPPSLRTEVSVDTAAEFQFLDVGAGQPQWPAEAA